MLNFVLTVLEQLIAKQVSAQKCYGCSRVVLSVLYYVCIYMCMHMWNMSMLTAYANTGNFMHAITLRISLLYSPGPT